MAVKRIPMLLRSSTNQAFFFGGSNITQQGYLDANMEDDRDYRRSTIGYVFTIGGRVVSSVLKLKNIVALSTIEAEYVAANRGQ